MSADVTVEEIKRNGAKTAVRMHCGRIVECEETSTVRYLCQLQQHITTCRQMLSHRLHRVQSYFKHTVVHKAACQRVRHEQMCRVCLQGLGPFTVVKSKCITRTKAWLEHHSPCRTGFGQQQKEDSMVDWNSQCGRDGSWCPYTVTDLMLSGNSINKFYFLLYSVFHYLFLLII